MSQFPLILEMKKLLKNLDGWIDKAVEFANHKKFDANTLLQSRLAPDMLPLLRQIQLACDHAKGAAARASGKDVPSHPDTEQTIADLKQRIATVTSYLDTFTAKDFEGCDERSVTMPRWEGKSLTATHFLVDYAQPNFYFHLTTAYALIRHAGVDVGKKDFIGSLPWR